MKFIWQTLWLRSSATRLQRRAGPAPERLTSHGSQLEGRLPCSSPLTPTPPLPAEILIQIFELLLSLNDVLTAYEALLDCSLVCKSWSHGAQITLLKHIEVVREEDAEKLVRHLGDIHSYDEAEASPVSSLSIGVQGLSSAFISRQTFGQLLGCTPRLQKLVIFQAKSLPDFPFYIDPPHLHNPTSLVDVTIASVGSDVVWTNVPHLEVLQHLPASVRFLQVLLPEPHNAAELVGTPHFSLYGLAMSQYPTSFAMDTRILHKSQQTLQCLTVWALRDIARLARSQPKLRSLKVVGPITDSGSLSDLQELERLETRFLDLPPNVLDSIPDSLQYLRFWSIDLAQSLGRLLVNKERLKKLQTVVWDYWFVTDDDKREGRQTIQSLREACASRDIGLRAYERSGDKLASQGWDEEYEGNLRLSCFPNDALDEVDFQAVRERPRFPSRVLANFYAMEISLPASLVEESSGRGWVRTPLFEECFEDWSHWIETALPRVRREKDAKREARRNAKAR